MTSADQATRQTVAANLRFSQRSLADFQICMRRFQLRYLDHLVWPAPFSEADHELEELIELGQNFHQAVHQHLLGIDPEELIAGNPDDRLVPLWEIFEKHALPQLPPGTYWPESNLSVPVSNSWLVARLDLLVISESGQAIIFDWKTGRPPDRNDLAQHMQTRVYPFVLAGAGHTYSNNQPLDPDKISMKYWYAQSPEKFIEFPYSQAMHARNQVDTQALINEIMAMPAESFKKTDDFEVCRRCNYRSYCNRDVEAVPAIDLVDEEVDFIMEEAEAYEIEEDI